mmetsp:Transcript_17774/g.45970  ORF Transcript_17774/g.45970 Transcript_17774/m.45970 type:complete len:210 (+) Transcript_17774:333-962(+)
MIDLRLQRLRPPHEQVPGIQDEAGGERSEHQTRHGEGRLHGTLRHDGHGDRAERHAHVHPVEKGALVRKVHLGLDLGRRELERPGRGRWWLGTCAAAQHAAKHLAHVCGWPLLFHHDRLTARCCSPEQRLGETLASTAPAGLAVCLLLSQPCCAGVNDCLDRCEWAGQVGTLGLQEGLVVELLRVLQQHRHVRNGIVLGEHAQKDSLAQ